MTSGFIWLFHCLFLSVVDGFDVPCRWSQHIGSVGDVGQTCFGLLGRHGGIGLQIGNGFT